jgi:plasmid stability protein
MEKKMYPSETADKFVVRLPQGMRDRIKVKAATTRRTMNSLIIHALDRALAADENESPAAIGVAPGSVSKSSLQENDLERING